MALVKRKDIDKCIDIRKSINDTYKNVDKLYLWKYATKDNCYTIIDFYSKIFTTLFSVFYIEIFDNLRAPAQTVSRRG